MEWKQERLDTGQVEHQGFSHTGTHVASIIKDKYRFKVFWKCRNVSPFTRHSLKSAKADVELIFNDEIDRLVA